MLVTIQLNRFLELMRSAPSEDHITAALEEFTCWLGFECFAMGHHVDLARPARNSIRVTNYNPAWIQQVTEQRHFADDPIQAASVGRVTGFRWDSLDRSRMTDRQRLTLEQASRYGLAAGYTVPASLPGAYAGTCSFAGPSFDHVCPLILNLSDMVVQIAFERVRLLMEQRDGRPPRVVPKLPPREREALILIGRGKTDKDIGEIMGISPRTAHSYVENVRIAYGNIPRPALMVRAMFDNQFAFADALWR